DAADEHTGEALAELIGDGVTRTSDLTPFDPIRLRRLDPSPAAIELRSARFSLKYSAECQTFRSSPVVYITGIALECIGATMVFGGLVRKPETRCGPPARCLGGVDPIARNVVHPDPESKRRSRAGISR